MGERVTHIGRNFHFQTSERYSYNPSYLLGGMDVVWENHKKGATV